MSKTITLTEHRPADGMLTMRVRNTTYNVNIFSIRAQRTH